MKFRKRPVVIEATQWFKNGDHPEDNLPPNDKILNGERFEGSVVRYYRTPAMDGQTPCKHCSVKMHDHGWIDTLEGGHIVCPGDWIITGVKGERYPCKPDIFEATYEDAETAVCPCDAVMWNEFNKVIQCHRCGDVKAIPHNLEATTK